MNTIASNTPWNFMPHVKLNGLHISHVSYTLLHHFDDGWSPITPNDPIMVNVAKFAVTTHNFGRQTHLVFHNVVGGETKNDGGQNYKLVIAAKDGDDGNRIKKYEALVIDRPYQNSLELEYFNGPI
ncbi:hypothetical protein L1987_11746 [Smallanthus sonchifolius]|uniref:Uncharacterized protein n=1 Tax=Smallanthus sonchifolius TaxID=185202 RepID=A0ACB9JBV6_9ASTR|nr:hypothetical protein L1987_11746 [Smallanthus sonchifolius]